MVIVGDPAFDYRKSDPAATASGAPAPEPPTWAERWKGLASSAREAIESFLRSPCRGGEELYFAPLAGARTEAGWVSEWARSDGPDTEAATAIGHDASEAWFKAEAPRATSLHIASHGFFDLSCGTDAPVAIGELPRSGIAFAGANRWREVPEGEEDGVLMANEIATLDLSGVRQVVLSACETAVGMPAEGEGLFGLTRALRLAGVDNQVVSLWPLEDSATLEWMKRFYTAQSGGADTVESVYRASLEGLRSGPEGRLHPALWAGFVPVVKGASGRTLE